MSCGAQADLARERLDSAACGLRDLTLDLGAATSTRDPNEEVDLALNSRTRLGAGAPRAPVEHLSCGFDLALERVGGGRA